MRTRIEMTGEELYIRMQNNKDNNLFITETHDTPISDMAVKESFHKIPSGLTMVLWEAINLEDIDARLSCMRTLPNGDLIQEVHIYADKVNLETDRRTLSFIPGTKIAVKG